MYILPNRKKHEKLFSMLDSNLHGSLKHLDRKSSILHTSNPKPIVQFEKPTPNLEKNLSDEFEDNKISNLDILSLDMNVNLETMQKEKLKKYLQIMKLKMK